jgi:hypothetical protein
MERPRGDDHVLRLNDAPRSLHSETRRAAFLAEARHLHAATNRRADFLGMLLQIVRNHRGRREPVRIDLIEGFAREAVMPSRTIGDERVPALGAPTFGDPLALYD